MITLRYEYIETNEENKKIYAKISSNGDSSEYSYSSCSEDNEEFKEWKENGGTIIEGGE